MRSLSPERDLVAAMPNRLRSRQEKFRGPTSSVRRAPRGIRHRPGQRIVRAAGCPNAIPAARRPPYRSRALPRSSANLDSPLHPTLGRTPIGGNGPLKPLGVDGPPDGLFRADDAASIILSRRNRDQSRKCHAPTDATVSSMNRDFTHRSRSRTLIPTPCHVVIKRGPPSGASVAQEAEPGGRVGHRYRSRCGTEVPNFHDRPAVSQSGRGDLNPRPPRPERGALPSCATSRARHDTGRAPCREPLTRRPAPPGPITPFRSAALAAHVRFFHAMNFHAPSFPSPREGGPCRSTDPGAQSRSWRPPARPPSISPPSSPTSWSTRPPDSSCSRWASPR